MFLAKAANAFLPKLVYQLEEYGLPRTLSRKIQNSGLIDLENDEMEVSDIIEEFKKIGYDKLTESIPSNPQLSSSASFLRLNVLSSLN